MNNETEIQCGLSQNWFDDIQQYRRKNREKEFYWRLFSNVQELVVQSIIMGDLLNNICKECIDEQDNYCDGHTRLGIGQSWSLMTPFHIQEWRDEYFESDSLEQQVILDELMDRFYDANGLLSVCFYILKQKVSGSPIRNIQFCQVRNLEADFISQFFDNVLELLVYCREIENIFEQICQKDNDLSQIRFDSESGWFSRTVDWLKSEREEYESLGNGDIESKMSFVERIMEHFEKVCSHSLHMYIILLKRLYRENLL
jgi:hypothetical protein